MRAIHSAWKWFLGVPKESAMLPEEDRDAEHRRLKDALIDEYRQANDRARAELKEAVPIMNARYVATMEQAMDIIRGQG